MQVYIKCNSLAMHLVSGSSHRIRHVSSRQVQDCSAFQAVTGLCQPGQELVQLACIKQQRLSVMSVTICMFACLSRKQPVKQMSIMCAIAGMVGKLTYKVLLDRLWPQRAGNEVGCIQV